VLDVLERLHATLSDRYAIDREIGHGGMARVVLAVDRKHGRRVAIKVMRPEVAETLGPERFLREIEIAARLTHPHILPLHDSGEIEGLLYYVMPFVEGESLRDRLAREHQLPVDDALRITCGVASALAYAHGHGVVHRDIKPENILLSAGHAVVSDFGIARAVSAAAADNRLTETGFTLGTAAYMSPEQATGERDVDGRSDIYSLGCVLYEMIAGEPPFTGPSAQAMIARRLIGPAPSLIGVRDEIPERLEWAVHKALARVPADRFATAEHFAAAISEPTMSSAAGRISHSATAEPRQIAGPAPGRSRSRRWRVIAAVSAVAAVGVGAWGVTRTRWWPGADGSHDRFAVLPFSVRGSEHLAYLGEGIVDLLSRNLDGVDDLQSIDPGTVLSALAKSGITSTSVDLERWRVVARRIGAGTYITGSVVATGPTLRIQASLYENGDEAPPRAQASVEGDTAQVLQLVDRLSAELMVKRRPGPVFRLTQTAAVTTRSLPALKAFLDGERNLRNGKPDTAIAGFQRAIAEDSTFALAYYRLAVAAGWAERHALSSDAVARALVTSDRLGDRDRRLLTAYAAFRRGAPNDAEQQYRAILEDYPDDLEAEFQLADVLFQYNPLRGRPRGEARELFDRVLALDPGFL
jgi:eukaryotic-like serine/threonine-protein kinase